MKEEDHRSFARGISARVAVLSITDSRTLARDESGSIAASILERHGHRVVRRQLVGNSATAVGNALSKLLADESVDAILTIGGTGVSRRDLTIDVVSKVITKRIDGFGELFRSLSYRRLGSSAMLSRALAGVRGEKVIFSLPGARDAVRLGTLKLVAPELGHILYEVKKR